MTDLSGGDNGSSPAANGYRRPRWLYGALIASLALNLLVFGGMARFFFHRHHGEHGLMGFVQKLPADRREPVGSTLAAEREKLKPLREAVKAAWTESNALLSSEPFDAEKFKAAVARTNEAEAKVRTAISDALVDTAGKLNADERKALKEWREHRYGGRGWGRHGKWRDRGGE